MPKLIQDLILANSPAQKFINTAQSIEFSRNDLVATSVSRSGRVITQTRNTVKPWTFKVVPPAVMDWRTHRQEIEELFIKDRHTEHLIKLGSSTSGAAWMSEYQGNCPKILLNGALSGVTIEAVSGNTMTLDVSDVADGTIIFEPGDIIQPAGTGSDGEAYRYPYAVVNRLTKTSGMTTTTITLNRGWIAQANYAPTSAEDDQNLLYVGNDCIWRVIVTKLPAIRLLPGKLAEFTGEVEFMEVVL